MVISPRHWGFSRFPFARDFPFLNSLEEVETTLARMGEAELGGQSEMLSVKGCCFFFQNKWHSRRHFQGMQFVTWRQLWGGAKMMLRNRENEGKPPGNRGRYENEGPEAKFSN